MKIYLILSLVLSVLSSCAGTNKKNETIIGKEKELTLDLLKSDSLPLAMYAQLDSALDLLQYPDSAVVSAYITKNSIAEFKRCGKIDPDFIPLLNYYFVSSDFFIEPIKNDTIRFKADFRLAYFKEGQLINFSISKECNKMLIERNNKTALYQIAPIELLQTIQKLAKK